MNIESAKISHTGSSIKQAQTSSNNNSSANFSEELKELKETTTETEVKTEECPEENQKVEKDSKAEAAPEKISENVKEIDKSLEELNSVVKELNQSDEKAPDLLKDDKTQTDNNKMINNDFNIQDNKDLLSQMNPNMNFSGDGQPFASFMNNSSENKKDELGSSAKDLAEEAAILSTMAENLAMVKQKTVTREDGIKKVDTKTNIPVENIVKFDSIIMNQADVEVFANLVENKEIDMNNLSPKSVEKSVQISKTLADMLLKAKENNQPLRIDFDNNISVIIKISRDGKISADFLPSSQVAEAYLKENLPLLKQRFDENNIDYNELNRRERRDQNREDQRKKGRNDE